MTRRGSRALRLVSRTLRRDLARRKVHREDSELLRRCSHGDRFQAVAFDMPAPMRSRWLPSRPVSVRRGAQHQEELRARAVRALTDAHVPFAQYASSRAGTPVIAVRSVDWTLALNTLTRLTPGALFAGSRGTLRPWNQPLTTEPTAAQIDRWRHVLLVDPAHSGSDQHITARYGLETGVRLECWTPASDGLLRPPGGSPRVDRLPARAFTARAQPGPDPRAEAELIGALDSPTLMEVTFPIDVVYTWVDGTDEHWLERKRQALETFIGHEMTEAAVEDLRFVDHDELRYSLRSLEQYAPWVRHIYLVTDGQRPSWLDPAHPRITVVDHRDIAPEGTVLPTFNSHSIETWLHRIEGLSEQFLYLNDDVFLSSPVSPDLFFSANGIAHMYLSRAQVAPGDPVPDEPASDSAGKNARVLVHELCGRRLSRKLFHAPFALQRSVSQEIEERWPDVVAGTRASQFRRTSDITLSGALHMNVAYATARAVTRGLRYRYVNVGAVDAAARLEGLTRDRDALQTFCLNESNPVLDPTAIDQQVRAFLQRRFPDISTFEIAGR